MQHGIGIPIDLEVAVLLYTSAAAQGNLDAQNNLDYCMQHGIGTPIDLEVDFLQRLATARGMQWHKSA